MRRVGGPAHAFGKLAARDYIAGMAEKPAPKPEDDTYSDEEAAKRMDATVRAMIGMKPKPHAPRATPRRASKEELKDGEN